MNFDNRSRSESQRYLCFTLNSSKYAVPLLQVKEVIGLLKMTPIPQSSPEFKGIMNLRGQIISVVDLAIKMQLNPVDVTPETTTIIFDFSHLTIGVIVDSVDSVASFEAEDISPLEKTEAIQNTDYVKGVCRSHESLTLILDLPSIFKTEDLKQLSA